MNETIHTSIDDNRLPVTLLSGYLIRQELVFVGQGLNQSETQKALDECLLTEEEMLEGPKGWRSLPDPFPLWEIAG
ncbi:hypothetical protein BAE46_09790 [Glaciecola punicea]|jgi:hypothetical protein|uniref:hypothetical protein n=1 Tax=Glaciecola punicea TaxID=56804 RepID=UPI000872BFBC|nr:hypothetical protein [Glaciecola punicea]OFA30938.1 hypothetical protein BAE46_09790 [Glaciecola punicea]